MANDTIVYSSYVGQIVPRDFSPGFIVLSYLVSYVGAWTTLELINRRTAGRGFYNWALLLGSAISMGGIAIWCMHFIGNRAIILADGIDVLQIAYNPGFTALSFFVPILVLLAAFLAVGSNDRVSVVRIVMGGALAGLGICGMHYLGQAGISNYNCIYQIGNIIGSAIIAIAASIMALSVFFVLRATWTNSWWKRASTAVGLAGGVSGMHWLASVGTQYRLKQMDPSQSQNLSNNSTVIVVIVLSISACFVLLAFTLLSQRRRSQSANRAQQVVLAAAVFDKDGRLMVTPEGLLPNTKITNAYIERSFDDVFGISHPVFLWIFRTSRNWNSISSLLPAMRNHLNHEILAKGGSRGNTKSAELTLTDDAGEQIEDYSIIFRELFCIAAAQLAEQFNEPVEKAGILFDEILSTGQKQRGKKSRRATPNNSVDLERDGLDLPVLGRGQLLFLVRSANRREVEHLQASGFRFANVQNIVDIVARSMQINHDDLTHRLNLMRMYASETTILEPGVHVACFAIRASVNGGFDVLVRKDARNQLPTMQMPLDSLDNWQADYLTAMDGWTLATCMKYLKTRGTNPIVTKKEQTFALQLHDTIEVLRDEIDDPFVNDALLVAKPMIAPCRGFGEDARPGQAQLITFTLIVPIHTRAPGAKLEFSPLTFFKMQQHLYPNSPDHDVFARKIHREFAPVLNQTRLNMGKSAGVSIPTTHSSNQLRRNSTKSQSTTDARHDLENLPPTLVPRPPKKEPGFGSRIWNKISGRGANPSQAAISKERIPKKSGISDTSSENHLVENQTFGGIMVSQEVSVDVREMRANSPNALRQLDDEGTEMVDLKGSHNDGIQRMTRMGTLGTASKESEDPKTFVDELFTVCIETR